MKTPANINDKAQFAIRLLKEYAEQNQLPARSTSDLSPLEEWLISKIYNKVKKPAPVTKEINDYVNWLLNRP